MTGLPLQWRLLDEGEGAGPYNMARDHALAREVGAGGVVRLYGWREPTVSLGRNEPAPAALRRSREGSMALPVVRRPTGGRSVLHHHEITYSVVIPARGGAGPRALLTAVHAGIVAGLRALGIPATVEEEGVVLHPDAGPCFQVAAPGEIVLNGGKLVGSAQARVEGALLQHGSLLLAGHQEPLLRMLGKEAGDGAPSSLADLPGGAPGRAAVKGSLVEGLARALGGRWETGARATAREEDTTSQLIAHYEDPAWTWRR